MSLILYTIELSIYYLVKYLLIMLISYTILCSAFALIRKLLFMRKISSDRKAVLITGCDSGFGNRLAQKFSQMGFKVYATVLNTTSEGAQELQTNPRFADNIKVMKMDVTNDIDVKENLNKVEKDLDSNGLKLWAVVNNAGILLPNPIEFGSLDTYRETIEINIFGAVRVTQAFLSLIRSAQGRITNMASILAHIPFNPLAVYCMSKSSLIAFTDTLRREMIKFNVHVSCIQPGGFRTNLFNMDVYQAHFDRLWEESTDEVKKFYGTPQKAKTYTKNCVALLPIDDNIDSVVDDVIDSVINRWPKSVYRPLGPYYTIAFYLNILFPGLADKLVELMESYCLIE